MPCFMCWMIGHAHHVRALTGLHNLYQAVHVLHLVQRLYFVHQWICCSAQQSMLRFDCCRTLWENTLQQGCTDQQQQDTTLTLQSV